MLTDRHNNNSFTMTTAHVAR